MYVCLQMSDFPEAQSHVSPEMAAILENLQKKNALTTSSTATSARQNLINASSIKETSSSLSASSTSSSQQVRDFLSDKIYKIDG